MARSVRDSYLKNPPSSANYSKAVSRIRQKGFHEDPEGNELDASAVYLVNPNADPINSFNAVVSGEVPAIMSDYTTNDSDITMAVGAAGKIREITHIRWTITTTATVGNRNMQVSVSDGINDVWVSPTALAVTASQLGIGVLFPGNFYGIPAMYNQQFPMPRLFLREGWTVRVRDAAAIDPAADDMTITVGYLERSA